MNANFNFVQRLPLVPLFDKQYYYMEFMGGMWKRKYWRGKVILW